MKYIWRQNILFLQPNLYIEEIIFLEKIYRKNWEKNALERTGGERRDLR